MNVYIHQKNNKYVVQRDSELKVPKNITPQKGDVFIGACCTYIIVKVGSNKSNEKSIWCKTKLNNFFNRYPKYYVGGIIDD